MSPGIEALRGRRVLFTGATREIGAALAERLASHGARLALVGLDPSWWCRGGALRAGHVRGPLRRL